MTWNEPIAMAAPHGDDAQHVVEVMAAKGVDLDVDRVSLLISVARQAHRRCLSHWLQANEPEYMGPPAAAPSAK